MPEPPRFPDRVRAAVRTRHYSRRTEEAYLGWAKRFILFDRSITHLGIPHNAEATGCFAATVAAYPPTDTLRTALAVTPIDSAPRLRNPRIPQRLHRRRPRATMRYAAERMTMLLQPNAT